MLTGRLLRDGVLQQSSLSANDAYCPPEKQQALLDLVFDVHDRCASLVERGVPIARIEEVDLSSVTRARDSSARRRRGDRGDCLRRHVGSGRARVRSRAPVQYSSVISIDGPLLCVEGVRGVGWDEVVAIHLDSGEIRHGVVLEASGELAVVQVFEGTTGLALDGVRVSFGGGPMRIPVGEQWLGWV
jgi:vacuolar-type H+-ATPase catalytic subunit A/Vma1